MVDTSLVPEIWPTSAHSVSGGKCPVILIFAGSVTLTAKTLNGKVAEASRVSLESKFAGQILTEFIHHFDIKAYL